jgi:hypothetical protein
LDAGLAAGHAVRSVAQCVDAARGDIATLTSMLELRTLAGADPAREALSAALAPAKLWPPAKYFQAKREEQVTRHARFNDTADNLEPNLKEGPGGLRDLHTVTWMGMRLYGVPGLRALVPLGLLGADECASLEQRWAEIARLRFGLHLVANRREEALLFDHQKALAALMGLQDEENNLAVEQMMQGFFRAAGIMLRINDRLLQRFEEQLAPKSAPVPVAPGFELRHGYLAMTDAARLGAGMAQVLELFSVWSGLDSRGLHSETARALAESLPAILPYPQQPEEVRQALHPAARGPARGGDAQAHGAHRRARAIPAGVRPGCRAHAVRPVPRLHGRPAHAHRAAAARELPARRAGARLLDPAGSGRAPAQALPAASRPGSSTTSPRAGAAIIPCSAPRTCAASPSEHGLPERGRRAAGLAGARAPADVGDRAEAGRLRSGGGGPLRLARRRSRAPGLPVPAHLRRHRRHQPEAVEQLEGPPARRPAHRRALRAAAAASSIRSMPRTSWPTPATWRWRS